MLERLPLNGWKTLLGWLLYTAPDTVPMPLEVAGTLKAIGAVLGAVGLWHKGAKERA